MGTVEFFYSKTLKDIDYQNLNHPRDGHAPRRAADLRRATSPRQRRVLLTNTDEGNQWTVTGKLERPFRNGSTLAAYLYGARSVNDGTSSQAASNWGNVYTPGNPNNPPLAGRTSSRAPDHRSVSYD